MNWKKINRFLATVFGVGNISNAPGTVAALGAAIVYYFFPFLSHPLLILLLAITGVLSCELEGKRSGIKDDSTLVIDEITGMWLCFVFLQEISLIYVILGFLLFRLFDIWKPLIIGDSQELHGGLGVMLDDILAAIPVNLILRLILFV